MFPQSSLKPRQVRGFSLTYLKSAHAQVCIVEVPGRWCSVVSGRVFMKTRYTVVLSMIAGAALGGAAIQGLHAQAKPPAYVITHTEVIDQAAFNEFASKSPSAMQAFG